jgi:hypothetical protein
MQRTLELAIRQAVTNRGVSVVVIPGCGSAAAGRQCWVIPPKANSAFVAAMEDVLAVYTRPHDPDYPLVCLDETSKQFLAEIARCAINELVPTLKAQITEQVMLKSFPDIALHAACLLSGGKGLLVNGRSGAGKSTLAVYLMEAGFEYAADDVVLIAPDGRATGVLFAPALKSDAWAMIEKFRPDLGKSAVHSRPDGKRRRLAQARLPLLRQVLLQLRFLLARSREQRAGKI